MPSRKLAVITLMLSLLILAARPQQVSYAALYDGDGGSFANADIGGFEPSHSLAADLSISKSDFPDPVVVGQPLTYSLNVTNNGPSNASGVTLTDTLPASVNFVSATSQGSCGELGGVVTCSLGNLTNASSTVAIIRVIPTAVGPITNTAEVMSNESDPDLSNNTATQTTV